MDQNVFNILVALVGALGGWWMKTMWESLRDLQTADRQLAEKVSEIEILVAGQYVHKTDFDKFSEALFRKLDKIDDKLDGKVDKP